MTISYIYIHIYKFIYLKKKDNHFILIIKKNILIKVIS